MAKGAKKTATSGPQVQLPNHWMKVTSTTGTSRCTECNTTLGRGMQWIVGDTRACQRCGQRLARTGLAV